MASPAEGITLVTTVSAPGKILLVGGYVVLESPNVGLVIAVDKRFYSTIKVRRRQGVDRMDVTEGTASANGVEIIVTSPQFGQAWRYIYQNASLVPQDETRRNSFIEKTLHVSLLYLLDCSNNSSNLSNIQGLDISIQADNDFYSLVPHLEERQLSRTLENAFSLPSFLPAATDPGTGAVYKTGLGSSACLVTSLVGALCYALLPSTTPEPLPKSTLNNTIYNLAQICHCYAQGKVGSGFDVSAACNGSHVYQKFPPEVLADLLSRLEGLEQQQQYQPVDGSLRAVLAQTVDVAWEGGVVAPLRKNWLLQVCVADVNGGSESPGMARAVLQWKRNSSSGGGKIPHWDDLIEINQNIVDLMQRVAELPIFSDEEKQRLIEVCSSSPSEEWMNTQREQGATEAGQLLYELRRAFADTRYHLKAMGEAAGVPIEPDQQTALADATLEIPGVVAALVPGAGGYDAMACLYINDEQVRRKISELWAGWTKAKVCPLTVQAADYGDGVRVESSVP